MNRRLKLLFVVLIVPLFLLAQEDQETITYRDTISTLVRGAMRKAVVLHRSPPIVIFVDYDILISSLEKQIEVHDVDGDRELLKLLQHSGNSIERRIRDAQSDPVLQSRLDFQIMNLLKRGKCFVQNFWSGVDVSRIVRQDYRKNWWTGTRFLTPDGKLFFDVRTGVH